MSITLVIDSPSTSAWAAPIGKLVLNFAVIEFYTHTWIADFTADRDLIATVVDWPFKRRVDYLVSLLEAQLKDKTIRDECIGTWTRTLDIAAMRNAIVHNPLVFGWTGETEEGPPTIVGIPDVGHLSAKPKLSKPIATLADINDLVNETAQIGGHLCNLRAQYQPQLIAQ